MQLLTSGSGAIRHLAYDSSGSVAAVVSSRWHYEILFMRWSLDAGKKATEEALGWCQQSAFSATGAAVAFGTGNSIVISRMSGKRHDAVIRADSDIIAMAFNAAGSKLAYAEPRIVLGDVVGSEISVVTISEPPYRRAERALYSGDSLRHLAFSPDDRLLATAGDAQITLWDLVRGESVSVWSPIRAERISFSPDGKWLAVAADGIVYLWDLRPHPKWNLPRSDDRRTPRALAFSPDGRILATGQGTDVRFWDVADGRQVAQWDWDIGPITAIAFAPDGLTAAAGSDEGKIVIWDLEQ